MKKYFGLLVLLASTGCGVSQDLSKQCGDDNLCRATFGYQEVDSARELGDLNNRVSVLESRLSALSRDIKSELVLLETDITNIRNTNSQNLEYIEILQTTIDARTLSLVNLELELLNVNAQILYLSGQVDTINAQDFVLGGEYFCGAGPGYREVGLVTRAGKFIAYFERGTSRHLTYLVPGQVYQTTDSVKCNFSVTVDGEIVR